MKKNKEKHPQPLPSIQSSFPGFILNDPGNVCNLFHNQNDSISDQNSNLTLSNSSDISISNDGNTEASGTLLMNSNNYFLNQILKDDSSKKSYNTPIQPYYSHLNVNEEIVDQKSNIIEMKDVDMHQEFYRPIALNQHEFQNPIQFNQSYTSEQSNSINPSIQNSSGKRIKNENSINSTFHEEETDNDEDSENADTQNNSTLSDSTTAQESEMASLYSSSFDSNEKLSKSKISVKNISLDPNKLGFLPRDFWIRSGLLTLDQIKRDFFRARSSKSLRFEFKLWNALAITKNYPSLFKEIGVKWVAHVLIMVHRDIFGKLLNVSRPSAALFSSCGAFMTHGFIEISIREAKQRLTMMSISNRALFNNPYNMSSIVYQNQSGQINQYFNRPNMYSNAIPSNQYPNQILNLNRQQQAQQVAVVANNNLNSNNLIVPVYTYSNQGIPANSFANPNFIYNPVGSYDSSVNPEIDFDLPSEIDESIIRLFTHKTGEFTEESHANEIVKCKWSNESRAQFNSF